MNKHCCPELRESRPNTTHTHKLCRGWRERERKSTKRHIRLEQNKSVVKILIVESKENPNKVKKKSNR